MIAVVAAVRSVREHRNQGGPGRIGPKAAARRLKQRGHRVKVGRMTASVRTTVDADAAAVIARQVRVPGLAGPRRAAVTLSDSHEPSPAAHWQIVTLRAVVRKPVVL